MWRSNSLTLLVNGPIAGPETPTKEHKEGVGKPSNVEEQERDEPDHQLHVGEEAESAAWRVLLDPANHIDPKPGSARHGPSFWHHEEESKNTSVDTNMDVCDGAHRLDE